MFNLENPFWRFMTTLADVVIVSMLWVLTNFIGLFLLAFGFFEWGILPIGVLGAALVLLSVGPSISAAYYVLTRKISSREGYILQDFVKGFKNNFKNGALAFIILAPIMIITIFNFMSDTSELWFGLGTGFDTIAMAVNLIILVQALFVFIHVFAMSSRFDMKFKLLMKTAWQISIKHMPTTLLHAAIFVLIIFISVELLPQFFLFSAGIYFWASSHLLIRIYRKYRPEMDRDPDDFDAGQPNSPEE
ncbi:MAG: DUF624 domain-containing protein [Defluviitaleaceae bacterium]|nr:DUF624 domain-containing protein [Defluviitaleaceae bacterium]